MDLSQYFVDDPKDQVAPAATPAPTQTQAQVQAQATAPVQPVQPTETVSSTVSSAIQPVQPTATTTAPTPVSPTPSTNVPAAPVSPVKATDSVKFPYINTVTPSPDSLTAPQQPTKLLTTLNPTAQDIASLKPINRIRDVLSPKQLAQHDTEMAQRKFDAEQAGIKKTTDEILAEASKAVKRVLPIFGPQDLGPVPDGKFAEFIIRNRRPATFAGLPTENIKPGQIIFPNNGKSTYGGAEADSSIPDKIHMIKSGLWNGDLTYSYTDKQTNGAIGFITSTDSNLLQAIHSPIGPKQAALNKLGEEARPGTGHLFSGQQAESSTVIDVPNKAAVDILKAQYEQYFNRAVIHDSLKRLYGTDYGPPGPEPVRYARTPDGTIYNVADSMNTLMEDLRSKYAHTQYNYKLKNIDPKIVKEKNLLQYTDLLPSIDPGDDPEAVRRAINQYFPPEALRQITYNRNKIIGDHDNWEVEMIKRQIRSERGLPNNGPAPKEPEAWIPAPYNTNDLAKKDPNWPKKIVDGVLYYKISLARSIDKDLGYIADTGATNSSVDQSGSPWIKGGEKNIKSWEKTGDPVTNFWRQPISTYDLGPKKMSLYNRVLMYFNSGTPDAISGSAIRFRTRPGDQLLPYNNPEYPGGREYSEHAQAVWNKTFGEGSGGSGGRKSSLLGKFDYNKGLSLLGLDKYRMDGQDAAPNPLFPDQSTHPLEHRNPAPNPFRRDDFAAPPSEGYFEQSNTAQYLVNRGPQAPSGAINRLTDQLSKYAADVEKQTGTNVLEGLDPEAVARSALGLAGNLGLTSNEALNNLMSVGLGATGILSNVILQGPQKTIEDLIIPQGLPDSAGAKEFERRVQEAKRMNPTAKFMAKNLEQLNKDATDYYNEVSAKYEQSNARGSLTASLGSVGGTITGFLSDPINLMTSALSFGSGIAKGILTNATQQAAVSLAPTIEGAKQGVAGSDLASYGLNVALAGLMGAVAPGLQMADSVLQGSIKPFLGKLLENRVGENQVSNWLSKGAKASAQAADTSSQVLNTLSDVIGEHDPQVGAHLSASASNMKNMADFMDHNPFGDSREATLMHMDTLKKAVNAIAEDEFPVYIPDTVEHHLEPKEIQKIYPHLTPDEAAKISTEVNKRVENPNMVIPIDAPNGTDYGDRQIANLKIAGTELDTAVESLNSPYSSKPVNRLSTPSGNYLPVIEKNGRIKTFESLSDAQAAISKMDPSPDKGRIYIGSSPDGKYTLVRDTPIKEIGRDPTYEGASAILKQLEKDGIYRNEDPKVIKFGKDDYRVLINTDDESLKTITNNPGLTKLNSSRKNNILDVTAPESQTKATIDRLLAEESTRLKHQLNSDDKHIQDMFIHNSSDLPDSFSYHDPVFGEITKANAASRWENIKKVIKQLHDCAGM